MRRLAVPHFWSCLLGALGVLLVCPLAAHAVPSITLGTYNLQPNQAGQTFNIYVSGGDAVEGVDLEITVGDGGTSGLISASVLQSVNLLATGAAFATNNTTQTGGGQAPGGQFYEATTDTSSGTVTLSGTSTDPATGIKNQLLLATVTIDTTGFFSGSYNISVGGTVGSPGGTAASAFPVLTEATDFPPETSNQVTGNSNFVDGTINIVPEPASLAFLGLAVPGLLLRRRRA